MLEERHVDLDGAGVEPDRVALLDQTGGGPARQGPPERHEGLAEAVAGALVRGIAPEQGRQLVARLSLPQMKSEVCQERFGLLSGKGDGRA